MEYSILEEHYTCFDEIMKKAFDEEQNIKKSILTVSNYLTTDSMIYDEILAKYPNVDKKVLRSLVIYNFLKINCFRNEKGIAISNWRKKFIDVSKRKTEHIDEYACADRRLFAMVINDALFAMYELSPTIEREIVSITISDGYSKVLSDIYPLTTKEFDEIISCSLTEKEMLLSCISDTIFEEYERIVFDNRKSPEVCSNLTGEIIKTIKDENKKNSTTIQRLARNFEKESGISSGDEYYSILLSEMFWSTMCAKKELDIQLTQEEEDLFGNLQSMNINRQNMQRFCIRNYSQIFESLMDSFIYFTEDVFLQEYEEFDKAKKDSIAYTKKMQAKQA